MFGKQKKQDNQSYQNPPVDSGIAQEFNNQVPMQNPINVPNIYQSQNQPTPIYQNRQVPVKQAIIIKAEMTEKGEYYYVLVTDYQLNLGNCEVRNI